MHRDPVRGLAVPILVAAACCRQPAPTGPAGAATEKPASSRSAAELVDMVVGSSGACGVFETHTAACWGTWDGGLFSVTTPAFTLRDVEELRGGHALTDPQHFVHHFCARDSAGAVWCWGNNREGQVGRSNHVDAATPDRVPLPDRAAGLALGMRHSCALTTGGEVWCWGANDFGQVSGPDRTVATPRRVVGVVGATDLIANEDSACALVPGGRVLCWGRSYGLAPVEVPGASGTQHLGGGSAPKCSIMEEGRVTCWGYLQDLVASDLARDPAVTIEGVPPSTMVASGTTHACACGMNGEIWCWGRGGEGELGTGRADPDIAAPARVSLPAAATKVVVAHHNTCARLVDRRWFCWGRNYGGVFGASRPVLAPIELDLGTVRFTAK